jgi:exodeoxyribonuclease-3
MRIVTWNVNSLKARQAYVERYLDAHRPDVIALQELKLEDDKVPRAIFETRGYHLETHGQKQYNGVAIASLTPLAHVERGLPDGDEGQSRMICASFEGPDGEAVDLINLYCPQGSAADSPKFAYKLAFYDALIAWLGSFDDLSRTLVAGDLNIAPEARDIWDPVAMAGVPSFHPEEHERWAQLADLGLEDVVAPRVAPGTYSFWDYRGAAFRLDEGMRIDHVLAGEGLIDAVHDAGIERPWRKKVDGLAASDHAPVWVELR